MDGRVSDSLGTRILRAFEGDLVSCFIRILPILLNSTMPLASSHPNHTEDEISLSQLLAARKQRSGSAESL